MNLVQTQPRTSEVMTILWVDDSPGNNTKEREKATKASGVEFELATSTDEALAWLSENEELLKAADSSRFRIVTDWYRPDEKDLAAQSLIQQVQDAGWKVPILVYCSESTDPYKVVTQYQNVAAATSDYFLTLYWATMQMTPATFVNNSKGAQPARKKTAAQEVISDEEFDANELGVAKKAGKATKGAKATAKATKAKSTGAKKKTASKEVVSDEEFEVDDESLPSTVEATGKAKSTTAAKKSESILKSSSAIASVVTTVKKVEEVEEGEEEEIVKVALTKKTTSTVAKAKKGAALVLDESDEEEAPIPLKKVASIVQTTSSTKTTVKAKKATALALDSEEEMEERPASKASSKVSATNASSAPQNNAKKSGSKLLFEEDDEDGEESIVATPPMLASPSSSKPASVKAPMLTPELTPVKADLETEYEGTVEMDVDEEMVDSKAAEDGKVDSTLPSMMEGIEKTPMKNGTPHVALSAKKSNIHDLLASRIPKADDDDEEKVDEDEDEAEEATIDDAEDEEDEPLPAIPKSRKSVPSAPPTSLSEGDATPVMSPQTSTASIKARKAANKASNQLFAEEDGDDGDEEFSDVDEHADEDESIEEDWDEEVVTKKKSNGKAKKVFSRLSKASYDDDIEAPAPLTPVMSKLTSTVQSKKDWNSFLLSRVPSSIPPGSPLSVMDDSTEGNEHLLLTPPPSVKKSAKKTAKKTPSDILAKITSESTSTTKTARKSATVVGVKSPPKSPDAVATPGPTPTSSPTEKPAPPKPTAPMGPTPMRSLSALDDGDEEEEDDDELPLFNKLPQPPVPHGSSSNLKNETVDPSKSTITGLSAQIRVGELAQVTIVARSPSGNQIRSGGDTVKVVLRTGGNAHEFDSYIEDNLDGTYLASFFPTRIGTYRVIVQINGKHILGGPFTVDIVAPLFKKRTSASLFSLDEDDTFITAAAPAVKRFKKAESSLPEPDELDGEIEATQVV